MINTIQFVLMVVSYVVFAIFAMWGSYFVWGYFKDILINAPIWVDQKYKVYYSVILWALILCMFTLGYFGLISANFFRARLGVQKTTSITSANISSYHQSPSQPPDLARGWLVFLSDIFSYPQLSHSLHKFA